MNFKGVKEKIVEAVVRASSVMTDDKKKIYQNIIEEEKSVNAKWILEQMLENAYIAEEQGSPMCDDTGVPHLLLEIGKGKSLTSELLSLIEDAVGVGLKKLPGRPMAVLGDDIQRIEQSCGLDELSEAVVPAPIIIKRVEEPILRLHILMQGGGPEIRGLTKRVFHHHDIKTVEDEIVQWSIEAVRYLGCSPCTLAIGIGRSHLESTALMTEAQIYGRHGVQTPLEKSITQRVNSCNVGPIGIGQGVSVLGTFIRIGPQRASGVRIVSLRPCCYMEPRLASVDIF